MGHGLDNNSLAFIFVNILLVASPRPAAGSVPVLLLQLHPVLTGDPGHEAAGVCGHQGILTWE